MLLEQQVLRGRLPSTAFASAKLTGGWCDRSTTCWLSTCNPPPSEDPLLSPMKTRSMFERVNEFPSLRPSISLILDVCLSTSGAYFVLPAKFVFRSFFPPCCLRFNRFNQYEASNRPINRFGLRCERLSYSDWKPEGSEPKGEGAA